MASSSATLTIAPTGNITLNQPFSAALAVTNGDTGAIQIASVNPYAYLTSVGIASAPYTSVDWGDVQLGPNAILTVPHGTSVTIPIPFIAHAASTQPAYSAAAVGSGSALSTNSYTIGADILLNNGEFIKATETTVTVVAPVMFNGR